MMPGMGAGDEGIRRLWKTCPRVVLLAENRAIKVHQAIEAGARGFISKSSSPDIILNALRLVLSGGIYLTAEVVGGPECDSPSRGM